MIWKWDLLIRQKAEALHMVLTGYEEKRHMKTIRSQELTGIGRPEKSGRFLSYRIQVSNASEWRKNENRC